MSNHATFEEEDLSALLDGELSASERTALEERLRNEPALRAEYDALAEARSFFAQHGPVAAPADLLGDILAATAQVDAEEGQVVQLAWYKRPLGVPLAGWAVAAAALLVVYVALPGADQGGTDAARVDAAARAPTKKEVGSISSIKDAIASKTASKADAEGAYGADPAAASDEDAVAMANEQGYRDANAADGLEMPNSNGLVGAKGAGGLGDAKVAAEFQRKAAEAKAADAKRIELVKGGKDVGDLWSDTPPVETEPTANGDKGVGFAQVPYQYTLYTDDSQALMQLAALAGRYRGEIAGPNDSALELEELVGTETATVIVKIPAHALQDFGRAIEGLGNVYSSADNRVFAGDPVEVRVKVQLAAGKPGTDKEDPKAARQKQQADFEVAESN